MRTAKLDFRKHGVQVIPSVFTKEEVDALKAAANRIEKNGEKNPRYKHQFIERARGDSPSLLFWPCLMDKTFLKFRNDKRLADIAQKYLGGNIRQLNSQFYFRRPKDGDTFNWHTDMRFRLASETFPNIKDGYLQTAIICDDWTKDNGAVEYILGSHLIPFEERSDLRTFKRGDLRGEKLLPKAGDVAIWDVSVIHASEENVSNGSRSYFMNGFAKKECAGTYPVYLENGELISEINHQEIP